MSSPPIATDPEGFLVDHNQWTLSIGQDIARQEGIRWTSQHQEMVELARAFYENFDKAPSARPFIQWVKRERGSDKGNSLYFMSLFPGGSARLLCKIAGLPKPPNCL